MSVALATECPVCAGPVAAPTDVILGELLDCDECGSELEVTEVTPTLLLAEAPTSAEDWGE